MIMEHCTVLKLGELESFARVDCVGHMPSNSAGLSARIYLAWDGAVDADQWVFHAVTVTCRCCLREAL